MNGKPFQTYEELVAKLRDEKGLSVPDPGRAIALLKRHSYFALISGYKSLFKQPNGQYRPSTTIDDILALFEFDDHLRNLFFQAIQSIEKHIKSLLSYAFVQKYGDSQQAYLSPESYVFRSRSDEVKKLIQTYQQIVSPPFDHPYIAHQAKKYGNVPLWVAIKAVTMGVVSKTYSLCPQDVQAMVSKEFPVVREHQLAGMLDFLTRVRNVCAHNERLYDFNSGPRRAIPAMPLHQKLGIGKEKSFFKKGQKDLFAALVCFYYLLPREEFLQMILRIQTEIHALCARTKQLHQQQILSRMGFPPNWLDCIEL